MKTDQEAFEEWMKELNPIYGFAWDKVVGRYVNDSIQSLWVGYKEGVKHGQELQSIAVRSTRDWHEQTARDVKAMHTRELQLVKEDLKWALDAWKPRGMFEEEYEKYNGLKKKYGW